MNMRDGFISINEQFRALETRLFLTLKQVDVGQKPNDGLGDLAEEARNKVAHNFKVLGQHLGTELHQMPEWPLDDDFFSKSLLVGAVFHASELNFKILHEAGL